MIAAGGTAGHVVPAIAVADALRAEGAEVTFVGGERAEAELVPAAGYELDRDQRRGHQPLEPAEGRARAGARPRARSARRARILRAPARRRRARRRRLRRRPGRARRRAEADPARARRGRLAPRPDQPRARPARARASASRSRSRAATASATASPAAPCRRPSPTAPTPAPQLGIGPDETVRARLRRLARRALDQPRGRRGRSTDAPYRVLHVAGTRDFAELQRARRRTTSCATTSRRSATALAAADLAVARSGGSVFELAQYGLPAVLIPYPHASADHQTTNARWMADAGAARRAPRRRAHARAPARARSTRSRSTRRLRAMSDAPRARQARRGRDIAAEVLAAAREAGAARLAPRP